MTTFARLAKILSGEVLPKNWIETAFKNIATSILPTIGDGDVGKFLKAGETGVEWCEIGSGAFEITLTVTGESEEEVYSVDKTAAEVETAFKAGKQVFMGVLNGEEYYIYTLDTIFYTGQTPTGYALSKIDLDTNIIYFVNEEGGETNVRRLMMPFETVE